jgi:glycosyltransferase involved in cell wall biosynthesis
LLFPIDWPEPFGLVMIEAMACGTPVVAWREGSVPEVVNDGISGRVVSGMEEAVAAVAEVRAYDRRRIRACFERRFDASHMVARYESLYLRLTEEQPILKKA